MDRKYTIIGLLLLGSALLCLFLQSGQLRESERPPGSPGEESPERPFSESDSAGGAEEAAAFGEDAVGESARAASGATVVDPLVEMQETPEERRLRPEEEIYALENDFIRVQFTSRGGAIKEVALKQYPAVRGRSEPYIFNEGAPYPALSVSRTSAEGYTEEYAPDYRMVKLEPNHIEFAREPLSGIELVRSYTISTVSEEAAPYVIEHVTTFNNRTSNIFNINRLFINVGTAPATDSDRGNFHLNFAFFDGEDFDYIGLSKFKGGGFLGFFEREPVSEIKERLPVVWAAAKNQFFTSILTPEVPGNGLLALPVRLESESVSVAGREGITGGIEFDLEFVKPYSERSLRLHYYVGPKEYSRLSRLEERQDLVMQFGLFGFIVKGMLYMLLGLHSVMGNYGVAIIFLTIIIRLLLWPLTAKAANSSKKMQKLQGPLQELRERYKDNKEKLQRETMKLWKEHGVNPLASCLPMLVQLPIFISFFYMLRSASELRFAGFIWIDDLSLPDTIATIGGFPFNPLPLVMAVSMFYQMRMTPMNVDPVQQKIFRMMPFIFLIFCYQFSSGLVLYWTMSNFFSIFQQYLTNRRKDPDELVPAVEPKRSMPVRKRTKKRRKR